MVNCENDGEPPARWLNVAGYCIQSNRGAMTGWLANCVFRYWANVCEGFYFLQIPNCISVPPQTCPFCIWKTTYKKKSRGCYLVDRSCPSSCPPAPLLWTPLAPRQGTVPFHPALCSHACFSAPDAFLHIMQKTAFRTLAKQLPHGQQQNVSLIFGVFFP